MHTHPHTKRFVCLPIQNFNIPALGITVPLQTPTGVGALPQVFDYLGPRRGGGGVEGQLVGNGWGFDITQQGMQNFNPACLLFRSSRELGYGSFFTVKHFQGKSATKTTARFFRKINV